MLQYLTKAPPPTVRKGRSHVKSAFNFSAHYLPSGRQTLSLLHSAVRGDPIPPHSVGTALKLTGALAGNASGGSGPYSTALIQILLRITVAELDMLRFFGQRAASAYRYYKMDLNMSEIPTSTHRIPDGGAIDMLARLLDEKKRVGVVATAALCQVGAEPCPLIC